jgi:preprotein translocase subunit YajC
MKCLLIIAMAQPTDGGGGGSMLSPLIFMGVIFFIFYFMMIRPQQKRQKERQKLLNEMKKGDKVITAGGIHGKIVALEERTVLVEISDNIKIKLERASIGNVIKESSDTSSN